MKILMIGGTKFLGRNIVEEALSRGHDIHLLQRGKTNSDIFPDVKKYLGDRIEIQNLIPANESFDLVIDTCGYHPHVVQKSCEFLKTKTTLYIFISTCSVYKDFSIMGLNENSEVATLETLPSHNDPAKNETYGPLKALCEQEVLKAFGNDKSLILRPCIIVGKYDETNRFNNWISSIEKNSSLEIPDDPEAKIQFIDVRSICDFVFRAVEKNIRGIYNTIGPEEEIRLFDFIERAKAVLNPELELKLVNPEEKDFPMYTSDKSWRGFFSFDGSKAFASGMKTYSVEETISATTPLV